MPHDVFISHATEDEVVAAAICRALEAQGAVCWIAARDVMPSMQYAEAIVNAIGASRLLVLVFSVHAVSSPHVPREVERAGSKGVPIVTFRIDTTPLTPALEYFLSQSQWLEALDGCIEEPLARLLTVVPHLFRSESLTSNTVREPTELGHKSAPQSDNILHAIWDCLDANLQDAFSLAFNKKRREGSTRISTRDFFQALRRIEDGPLCRLLESLPEEALPEPAAAQHTDRQTSARRGTAAIRLCGGFPRSFQTTGTAAAENLTS